MKDKKRRSSQRSEDRPDSITFDLARDVQAIKNGTFDSKSNGPEIGFGMENGGPEHVESNTPAAHPEPVIKRKKSRSYAFVSYAFVAIFLILIGYMVYFSVELRGDILTNPYNNRKDALARYVSRGSIITRDGVVVARSETDSDGDEERIYPYGREYAHVIGYSVKGKSGLEAIANYDLLTSHAGIAEQLKNELTESKNPGDNVITTLDHTLQSASYEALGDYDGAVIIMDASTGAFRAMVSKPDFDPNTIAEEWNDIIGDENSSVLLNRATQGRYAPGSTYKIVTALAYYRRNNTLSGFDFDCTGEFTLDDHTVHCYENSAHGHEDLMTAFANSCNCAFSRIGLDLGPRALISTSEDLLFNKKLPSAGLEYNKSSFALKAGSSEPAIMQTSFGQGQTITTPLHMLLIASAVANGGKIAEPYLVEKVESYSGEVVSSKTAKTYRSIMSAEEAGVLKYLMRNAVTMGTGRAINTDMYDAYGKTGSAEYMKRDGTLGTHSWFVGFVEKDGEKLAIAVIAENGGSGSQTAVPMARQIFDTYYGAW